MITAKAIAASTPTIIARKNGKCSLSIDSAVPYAPTPKNATFPNAAYPVYPPM